MSGATIIAEAFGENANLYTQVLGLSSSGKDVSASQLRKAYYKRALKYHPDKQQENDDLEDAKLKFQAVSLAYNLLSDPEKRKEYDETGELNDDDYDGDDGNNKSGAEAWAEYFRGIFGTVSTEDIDKFTLQYKCSEEEEKDVLKYYAQFKGNLDKMLECVMCSQEIDKKRWVQDYIQPAIQNDTVPDYTEQLYKTLGDDDDEVVIVGNVHEDSSSSFMDNDEDETESEDDESEDDNQRQNKKRRKTREKLANSNNNKKKNKKVVKKAMKTKHTAKSSNNDDLIAAIRGKSVARRQEAFDNMLMGLEERYASSSSKNNKSKKTKKQPPRKKSNYDDIPDDEFEKIRSKLGNRRK